MKREPEQVLPQSVALYEQGAYANIPPSSSARKRTRGACKFKPCDVTRALKAVAKAGLAIERVEVALDGNIVVSTKIGAAAQSDYLDRELAEFEAGK